jgi:ABC-type nickel/cobalt efflux system permease component RcnA
MITALSLISLGFFLGMRHATDPDHVIAISTIVGRQRTTIQDAILIGALWGIGHTLTVIVVGGAIILFSVVIPPRLGLTMEMAAALMLVVLGMWNLTGILHRIRDASASRGEPASGLHAHLHTHGDYVHSHPHGHGPWNHGHREDQTPQAWLDQRLGRLGLYQVLRPLVVGLVHGLAGSAAVALLVLATIPNPWWAIWYLMVFGIGTIVGMLLITVVIAAPLAYASTRFSGIDRYLRVASGLMSLAFGLFLAYQIGFRDGLFTRSLTRTPQ